jgi:HPt (histidine-containing phosphotransfer) domain-containing protein
MTTIRFEELAESQGLDDAAVELMPLFASQLAKTLRTLREAAQRGDREEVARLCGRLSGSAAVYGYKKLAAHLNRVEVYLLCGELSAVEVVQGLELVAQRVGLQRQESGNAGSGPRLH